MGRLGEDAARLEVVQISKFISNFIKGSFGPNGLWNIVVDKNGVIHWTKSGATTLNKIAPKPDKLEKPDDSDLGRSPSASHPIGQMIADVVEDIVETAGDGSKTAIILIGELLRKWEKLPLHPAIFIEGCISAMKRCLEIIDEVSVPLSPKELKQLRAVVRTFFKNGTRFEDEFLADIVLKATYRAIKKVNNRYTFNSEDIDVRSEVGGTFFDTKLVDGIAFFKEILNPDMPNHVKNAKVAVIAGELRPKFKHGEAKLRTRAHDHKIILKDPKHIQSFHEEEKRFLCDAIDKLANLGVKVTIIEKGVDPVAEELFTQREILVIRRFHPKDLERIAKVVNATAVPEIEFLTSKDLGYADLVEERKIEDHPWIFIRRAKSDVTTILVRGPVEGMVEEAKRMILNSLRVVEKLSSEAKVVAGGGALEVEMANKLRIWAGNIGDRKKFAIEGFAEVLETIPMLLAESCGLDPIDSITELRMRHHKGETWTGIDVFEKKITNMLQAEVYETALIKKQIIRSACEAVVNILRIDDFIAAKRTVGDMYWKKRQEKFTEPGRVKKIHREYGIDV